MKRRNLLLSLLAAPLGLLRGHEENTVFTSPRCTCGKYDLGPYVTGWSNPEESHSKHGCRLKPWNAEPRVFHMSKVGDPYDWDEFPASLP